jgi:sporulation-control protein spo0M
LDPLGVVDHGGGVDGAVNMVDEAEFLELKFKERAPLLEVTIIRGESDRNVAVDVDRHNGGSWRWDQIGLGLLRLHRLLPMQQGKVH